MASHRDALQLRKHGHLFLGDLTAPGKDLGFGAGGFGFLDVAVAIVEKRKARPGDLIVRPELRCLFAGLDRFREAPGFHQGHAERMPAVKKCRIELDAAPVFLDGAFQLANRQIAVPNRRRKGLDIARRLQVLTKCSRASQAGEPWENRPAD